MRERRIRSWSRQLLAHLRRAARAGDRRAMLGQHGADRLPITSPGWISSSSTRCRPAASSPSPTSATGRCWAGWCDRAGTIFIARGSQRDVRHIFQGLVQSIACRRAGGVLPGRHHVAAGHGAAIPRQPVRGGDRCRRAGAAVCAALPGPQRPAAPGGRLRRRHDFRAEHADDPAAQATSRARTAGAAGDAKRRRAPARAGGGGA